MSRAIRLRRRYAVPPSRRRDTTFDSIEAAAPCVCTQRSTWPQILHKLVVAGALSRFIAHNPLRAFSDTNGSFSVEYRTTATQIDCRMPSATAAPSFPNNAEPCLASLPPETVKLLQTAASAIRTRNLDAAVQVLRSALDIAPDHPEVLRPAGLCHMRAQRYDATQAVLQRGVAQWSDYALAHSDLGSVQSAMGAADACPCQLAQGL